MNGIPDSAPSSDEASKAVRPETAELRAKLDQWILWVRENVDAGGDIPSVRVLVANAAKSNGKDLLFAAVPDRVSSQALESCWGNRLAESPVDLGVRAGVLCCAFWNLHKTQVELDDFEDFHDPIDEAEEVGIRNGIKDACARLEKTLALLVRFLLVEDCTSTWRHFRWEVLNSYLIHDWDRAARFYNRAEDIGLRSPREIGVFRGQFRFLVVFGDAIEKDVRRILKNAGIRLGLDSLFWEPAIYPSGASEYLDQLREQLLFKNGMCDEDRGLDLNDSDRSLLLDAANDLQKALLVSAALPYLYRAVLARCHYCVGRFHDAAEQYRMLLGSEGQSGQPKVNGRLFASLSLSYRQAGETERAKEILQRWARELPDEKGIYLQLAELEAQSANYQGVVEYLRKETDRNPAVDTDWKVSALLTLGGTQDTAEAIKNELKNNSDLWNPVCSMLVEYWGPFSNLGEKAREKWVFGMVLRTSSGLPERMRLNEAAVACIATVEIGLRDRVFRKFKEHVLGRPSLKTAAEEGLRDRRSDRLCQFLVRDGDLTLGEMATILKMRGRADEPMLRDFQNWTSRTQLRLMKHLDNLERVVAFRNPAIHENRIELNPEQIIQSCRTIIEALN